MRRARYAPLAETRVQLVSGQRLRNGLVMLPYTGYDLATAGIADSSGSDAARREPTGSEHRSERQRARSGATAEATSWSEERTGARKRTKWSSAD